MFGLGVWELGLILLVVMFFFGAKRIPVIGRGLGQGIRNFKRALKESDDTDNDRTLGEPRNDDD